MKKLFAVLILIAMFAATVTACNGTEEPSDVSNVFSERADASDSDSSAPKPETENNCWLPEKNWDTTLVWASVDSKDRDTDIRNFEIWCEEDLGDTLSKTVVERSDWLQNTYGIVIDLIKGPEDGPVGYAKTAVEASLPLDVISQGAIYIAESLSSGYYYDIREINSNYNDGKGWISMSEPYWDQGVINDLSINHKVFMLTGDALLYDDEATWVMFFNKKMVEDYGFENPYTTVKNKEWTCDRLYEYAKLVTMPVGEKPLWQPDAHDKWGLVTISDDGVFFMLGFEQPMVTKDSNDLPVMRFTDERYIDITQKLISMLMDENVVGYAERFGAWNSGVYQREKGIFAAGDAMFMPQQLAVLSDPIFQDSDVDIGVIPMPMADELQEDYAASGNMYWTMMIAIPITNVKNLEATLFALEAMAWYGDKYIMPEYYEKVLKLQKFRDEDAEEMLDLIFSKKTYEMGCVYNWGNMVDFYHHLVGSKSTDVVSKYESYKDQYQAAIDDTIAAFTAE